MKRIASVALLCAMGTAAFAGMEGVHFASIDGGTIGFDEWKGQPVLVVNTASQCAYTPQYEALQDLHEAYSGKGLVVLAVPSDDFRQELDSSEAVKEFCELTFGLTLPMADITHVVGREAHPFYVAVKAETGFEPRWNFNKVLIGKEGEVRATWGSNTRPNSRALLAEVEAALAE